MPWYESLYRQEHEHESAKAHSRTLFFKTWNWTSEFDTILLQPLIKDVLKISVPPPPPPPEKSGLYCAYETVVSNMTLLLQECIIFQTSKFLQLNLELRGEDQKRWEIVLAVRIRTKQKTLWSLNMTWILAIHHTQPLALTTDSPSPSLSSKLTHTHAHTYSHLQLLYFE